MFVNKWVSVDVNTGLSSFIRLSKDNPGDNQKVTMPSFISDSLAEHGTPKNTAKRI